jgi:RNA polymerase sigma-70 factor (family 1)
MRKIAVKFGCIMREDSLASQLKDGNQLAFTMIYKQYASQAFSLAYKYLCDQDLAEDAVQNVFLKLWDNREDIDSSRPVNYLLFTMLKNDLLNTLRNSRRREEIVDNCLETLNCIDNAEAEEKEITEEKIEIFKRAIERLSPQRRAIFTLKVSGKYSNQEIADQMHLSINTIKFQYSQSLKLIKQYANEYGTSMIVAAVMAAADLL